MAQINPIYVYGYHIDRMFFHSHVTPLKWIFTSETNWVENADFVRIVTEYQRVYLKFAKDYYLKTRRLGFQKTGIRSATLL